MKVLAVDSSAKSASVCVIEDEKILGEFFINTKLTHSETLMPMISSLLKNARIDINSIDVFAISSGPGSFTGVRIGIAAVKGMSFALNKPCVGVSTLEAMAYNFKGSNCIISAVMDARRDQVYNALFRVNCDNIIRLTSDRAISIEDLNIEIKNEYNKENIVFVGDGADLCYNKFNKSGLMINLAEEHVKYQRASGVAVAALKKIANNQVVSSDELMPIYLRPSQAEQNKDKINKLK